MSVTITYVNQMMTTKVSVVFFKGKGLLGDRKKREREISTPPLLLLLLLLLATELGPHAGLARHPQKKVL